MVKKKIILTQNVVKNYKKIVKFEEIGVENLLIKKYNLF